MKATPIWIGVLAGVLLLAGTGCRSVYYATWEKLGVEKRDLLTKAVVAARDEQKAAGEEFQDALSRLQQITSFDGGKLEAAYRELRKDSESAEARAAAVGNRIRRVEQVSGDLFAEWEQEIKRISTPHLRAGSEQQLRETRERYGELHAALTRAERSMAPVLTQLRDYTLYLKHNLNATAIASLRGEAANIQADIGKLLEDMNASIAKADEFVRQMGGTR
jgi:DNA repair exonuclease SbcCD ATPase subunit